jgi:hypothetical protein
VIPGASFVACQACRGAGRRIEVIVPAKQEVTIRAWPAERLTFREHGHLSKQEALAWSFPADAVNWKPQATNRTCVKFGLGEYLYRLPKTWAEYDAQKRAFTDAALVRLQKLLNGEATLRGIP